VDIYVEPGEKTVNDMDLRMKRYCRNDLPFLILFIPLSLPALRYLIKMSANATCNDLCITHQIQIWVPYLGRRRARWRNEISHWSWYEENQTLRKRCPDRR
jgi:hypothetical protein